MLWKNVISIRNLALCFLFFSCFLSESGTRMVVQFANAEDIIVAFLRIPGADLPDYITGMKAAVLNANQRGIAPGHNFVLELHDYPHCNLTIPAAPVCDLTTPGVLESGTAAFIGNMSRFHAILFPQFATAPLIIAAAKARRIPVIDPLTIADEDYKREELFMFSNHIETELAVLMKYMLSQHSCARTGVVYDENIPNIHDHLRTVREAFATGGYPAPAELSFHLGVSMPEVSNFVYGEDPSRACFLFLTAGQLAVVFAFYYTLDPRFQPGAISAFMLSYSGKSQGSNSGASFAENPNLFAALATTYFPEPTPSIDDASPALLKHFGDAYDALVAADVSVRTKTWWTSTTSLNTFIKTTYPLELYARVAARYDVANTTDAWQYFIDIAHTDGDVWIADYPIAKPIRSCLPYPMDATCQCNVVVRFLYLFSPTLVMRPDYSFTIDVASAKESIGYVGGSANVSFRPIAATYNPHSCKLKVNENMMPIPLVTLTTAASAASPIVEDGLAYGDMLRMFAETQNTKAAFTNKRPRRIIVEQYPTTIALGNETNITNSIVESAETYMHAFNRKYEPFVILASDLPIVNARILTIASNGTRFPLTDPPLAARPEWNENTPLFMPAFADYAHALVSYYAATKASKQYTSLVLMAGSEEEAALIGKSLYSFQIKRGGDMSEFTIATSASQWLAVINSIIGNPTANARPFIIAAASQSNSMLAELVNGIVDLSGSVSEDQQLTIAVCGSDGGLDETRLAKGTASLPSNVLVVFPSVLSEWWLPTNALRVLLADLGAPIDKIGSQASYYIRALGYVIADQLSSIRTGSKSAAELLYTARTASFADVPLGPFSNDTCSDEVIKANAVDRTCQCNKGFRLFRVHSVNDWRAGRESTSTGRHSYQMTTCGVNYLPLIEPAMAERSSAMTAVAIGVGVGGGSLLLILVGVIVAVLTLGGRNNRAAPKDSNRPFSIAFTDIQSSTSLWARCPAIMSESVEHHGMLIRSLIKTHRGYEVKTIGDSFMVAFVEAEDAACFAVDLQEALYNDYGWSAELDQHYKEIILESGDHDEDDFTASCGSSAANISSMDEKEKRNNKPAVAAAADFAPNAPADELVYQQLWRGLRVRVGVHFGFGEIRKDAVTLGYDYFGTVVNTAARVEGVGHGGQTLATDAFMKEIGNDFVAARHWTAISLGPQHLRGLDDKVVLVQLLPASLRNRRFPPLRLDVENAVENNSASEKSSVAASKISMTTQGLETLATAVCNDVFRTNTKKKADVAVGVKGITTIVPASDTISQTASQRSMTGKMGALVPDLIHHFKYLTTLFSTSPEAWRKESIKQLAARWHVKVPGGVTTEASRARTLMQVSLRAVLAQKRTVPGAKTYQHDERRHSDASAVISVRDGVVVRTSSLQSRNKKGGQTRNQMQLSQEAVTGANVSNSAIFFNTKATSPQSPYPITNLNGSGALCESTTDSAPLSRHEKAPNSHDVVHAPADD